MPILPELTICYWVRFVFVFLCVSRLLLSLPFPGLVFLQCDMGIGDFGICTWSIIV